MTQDDIIRMARDAGFLTTRHLSGRHDIAGQSVARFERFAALVAAAEREACAEVCDLMARRTQDIRSAALEMAAENIRARSKE